MWASDWLRGGADSVALVRALSVCSSLSVKPAPLLAVSSSLPISIINSEETSPIRTKPLSFTSHKNSGCRLKYNKRANGKRVYRPPQPDPAEQVNLAELDTDEASLRHARMRPLIQVARMGQGTSASSLEKITWRPCHHPMRGTGPSGLAGIGHPLPIEKIRGNPSIAAYQTKLIRHALSEQNYAWRGPIESGLPLPP